MNIENFLSSFPLSESTKSTYRRAISHLPENTADLSASDLIDILNKPEWGSSHRHATLCAWRKYLAWKHGAAHPALGAKVKRAKPKMQRRLNVKQATELLASFDTSTTTGKRDLAIAALALDTGLRCSELCRVNLADVDREHHSLQVIVKGGQWKGAIYSPQTALYIENWLAVRAPKNTNALFLSFHHVNMGGRLTREGLQRVVKGWGEKIGIKLSPHDFRRSFATLATIFGAPSRIVQEAGRWSDIAMVERYTAGIEAEQIRPYLPVERLK